MITKSVRGFLFAFGVVTAPMSASSVCWASLQDESAPAESPASVTDSNSIPYGTLDEDQDETAAVDFDIRVLFSDEAAEFMRAENISEQMLEEQALASATAGDSSAETRDSSTVIVAGNNPFDFLSRIFGSGSGSPSNERALGRYGRRHRGDKGDRVSSSGGCSARSGHASYYGPGFAGHRTASGARFNPSGFTAAHRTLKFGSRVRVTHGDRSVVVTINDRGPFVGGRVIDLSQGAARVLGLSTGFVTLQVLKCN